MSLSVSQIDNYRVEQLVWEDSFSRVYYGFDVDTGQHVIFKLIQDRLSQQPAFRQQFTQLTTTIGRLNHPALIKIETVKAGPEQFYIVTNKVTGQVLGEILQPQDPVKWQEALLIGEQIADALEYVHNLNLIHGPLTPDDVWLTVNEDQNLHILLPNLNLFVLLDGEPPRSFWPYLSPEQCLGETTTPDSDIYSLGVLLYRLMVGTLPFVPTTYAEAVRQHTGDPPPNPQTLRSDLPSPILAILHKALAKQPGDRFSSAAALKHALRQARQPLPDQMAGSTLADMVTEQYRQPTRTYDPTTAPLPSQKQLSPLTGSDHLIVTRQAETARSYPLQKSVITIGREVENDIVLPDTAVSTHHAYLQRSAQGWEIVDAGSSNGTLLEGRRLPTHEPHLWPAQHQLQIGPYFLFWQPPDQTSGTVFLPSKQEPEMIPQSNTKQPLRVDLSLQYQTMTIIPGQGATNILQLHNQMGEAIELQLALAGDAAAWCRLSGERVTLLPNTASTIPFAVEVAKKPEYKAGSYTIRLELREAATRALVNTISANLTVQPYDALPEFSLIPSHPYHKQRCYLEVTNQSNTDGNFRVEITPDTEGTLHYQLEREQLELQPGEKDRVQIRLRAKERPVWGRTAHNIPFTAWVSREKGKRDNRRYNLQVLPYLTPLRMIGMVAVVLLVCLGAVWAFGQNPPENDVVEITPSSLPDRPIVIVPTPSPTALPELIVTPEPQSQFFNFRACDRRCIQAGAQVKQIYPERSQRIFVAWDYRNMQIGTAYTRIWYTQGTHENDENIEWVRFNCVWQGDSEGTFDQVVLRDEFRGLRSGIWTLVLLIEGREVLRETILVEGTFDEYVKNGELACPDWGT